MAVALGDAEPEPENHPMRRGKNPGRAFPRSGGWIAVVRFIVACLCVNRWSWIWGFGAGPAEGDEAGSENSDGLRHSNSTRI